MEAPLTKCSREAGEFCSRWQELQQSLSAHSVIVHEGTDRRWSTESEQGFETSLGDVWSVQSLDQLFESFKHQEGNFMLDLKMH